MMRSTTATDGYSFRLDVDSSSTYSDASTAERSSIYKRRIDSLFRDTRAASSTTGSSEAAAASNSDYEVMELAPESRSQQFHEVRNAVQAQIEKMFSGGTPQQKPMVHREPARAPEPARLAAPQPPPPAVEQPPAPPSVVEEPVVRRPAVVEPRPESTRPAAASGVRFKVDYLGALGIEDRATRLEDLQFPLKRLYMEYRVQQKRGKTPLPGTLEITDSGVKVQYVRELHRGVQEVFNPFQTIAVWAAVKFVAKRQKSSSGHTELKFAFLPLICDPESQEKFTLYNDLAPEMASEAIGVAHPPVFACVMRKPGLVKSLECHGFVCSAPEDAIVIAANLYQALLSSMRSEPASSSPRLDTSNGSNSSAELTADEPEVPRRPPRRRRAPQPPESSRREPTSDDRSRASDLRRQRSQRGRVSARTSSVRSPSRSRSRARNSHGSSEHSSRSSSDRGRSVSRAASTRRSRRLTRSASDRHGVQLETTGGGRLPRSRSFAELHGRVDIKQLLAQIQARDGIRTVDDVLRQVVNPGGMSFSDLRPEHRELLLRLALTLSKDEMYQRSKHIMKKQTKKLSSVGETDTDGSTISSVLKATKKSFSRFSSRSGSFQSPTSYLRERTPLKKLYNARGAPEKKIPSPRGDSARTSSGTDSKSAVSRLSSSSGSSRAVPKTPMPPRAHRVPPSDEEPCDCGCDSESVYSSKCYCTLPRAPSGMIKARSTYDLPCACDTESCAESEKCYCSLKRVSKSGLKVYQIRLDSESETTDGGGRSTLGRGRRREYGSLGNLSRADSPSTAWQKNTAASLQSAASSRGEPLRRGRSSSSLMTSSTGVMRDKGGGPEYADEALLARRRSRSLALSLDSDGSAPRPPPTTRPDRKSVSIDNLHQSANGFIFNRMNSTSSMSTTSNRSRSSAGSGGRFLLVSAADPSGKIVYRGASQRQAARDGGDAISMKKTTEIAATFSGLKLNQTTDLLGTESEDDAYSSMQNISGSNSARSRHGYSDQNIETSLGYLP